MSDEARRRAEEVARRVGAIYETEPLVRVFEAFEREKDEAVAKAVKDRGIDNGILRDAIQRKDEEIVRLQGALEEALAIIRGLLTPRQP